jgi:hypothetical protein
VTAHARPLAGHLNQWVTRCSCSGLSPNHCFFDQPWGKSGSRPVSRVLSGAIIPLGCTSPCTSSGLPGNARGPPAAACAACFPIWPCSRRGLPCRRRCRRRGALLPHHFNLAVTLARAWAVYFLLHFPWARAPQALPGAVPCGARTFLRILANAAIAWPTPATTIERGEARLKSALERPLSTGRARGRTRRSGAGP